MASVGQSLFRLFRGAGNETAAADAKSDSPTPRPRRHSSGLGEFTRIITGQENLCILDLGSTSPQNIGHLTGLGHRVYNEDVLTSSVNPDFVSKNENGTTSLNLEKFLRDNLNYKGQQFDAILCWDIPDYLHESLVKVMIEKFATVLKPGGVLLAYFHTKDAGPEAPYFRYHIAGKDSLDMQRGPQFRLQRIFNNRHIENLFHDFASIKFFLARDNVREVLVVR
jgi:SAM-dependent methyltransferase